MRHDETTGIWGADKPDSDTFKRSFDPFDRFVICGYRAVEAFQSTHGRNRDPGVERELCLLPSGQRSCCPDLTCDYKHRSPCSDPPMAALPISPHQLTQTEIAFTL